MPTVSKQGNNSPSRKTPITKSGKGGSVLDRISPIGFSEDDGIQILLYGKSGTGKTTLWSSFPGPILAIVCSGGNNPGELRSIDTEDNRGKISQVVLESSQEVIEIVQHVQAGSIPFKTLVLDHASGLQDLVLKEILGLDSLPAQKTWGLATQQQYGQLSLKCKELFRALLGVKSHVVIVAQEKETIVEGASDLIMPSVGSALTPSLAGWLNTAVDYICQTFIRQQEEVKVSQIGTGPNAKKIETRTKLKGRIDYCLRTSPDPVFTVKFRVPKGRQLPPEIIDPDFDKIMQLIKG